MQRKDILKGKVYRAKGGLIIRALSNDASPIEAEVYDFVSQTFIKEERGIKPVDLFGAVGTMANDIIDGHETINNAHDTRQLLAQIDAFNEAFKTEAKGPNRVQQHASITPIAKVTVTVPLDGYGRAVEALALPPLDGSVSIPGDDFIRFTLSRGLPLVQVPDLTVGGYPGIPLELLTTENVAAVKAEQKRLSDLRSRAFKVVGEVRDALRAEAEAAYVHVEGKRKPYLSYKDVPDHEERVRAALEAEGLTGHYPNI